MIALALASPLTPRADAILAGLGDYYVADADTGTGAPAGGIIRVDSSTGTRTLVSDNNNPAGIPEFSFPWGIAVEASGDILTMDIATEELLRTDPSTGARTLVSSNALPAGGPSFVNSFGLAVEASGDIVVADSESGPSFNGALIRVDPVTGGRTVLSQNGSPGGNPRFQDPVAAAIGSNGDIYVLDIRGSGLGGFVIKVDPVTGARTLVSRNTNPPGGPDFDTPWGIDLTASGDILVADEGAFAGSGGVIKVEAGTGTRTTVTENASPPGAPLFHSGPFDVLSRHAITSGITGDPFFGVIGADPVTGARSVISENTAPAGGPDFQLPRGITVAPIIIVPVFLPGLIIPGGGGGGGHDDDQCRPGKPSGSSSLASEPRRCGVSFTLSDPATMGFALERRLSGRVVKGKCRRPGGKKRKGARRCPRYRRVGGFKRQGAEGENFAAIPRKLGGKLGPGAYRVTLRGGDAEGNRTVPVSLEFRVVD